MLQNLGDSFRLTLYSVTSVLVLKSKKVFLRTEQLSIKPIRTDQVVLSVC